MEAVVVRAAEAGDVPAIGAIWRGSMALHGERDPSFVPRAGGHLAFAAWVSGRIGEPDAAVVAATVGGEVAAYGVAVLRTRAAFFEPSLHGLVTDLDVAAAHRRQGLGERVLDALCDWLRGRGIERVEAEGVMADEISMGFWRRSGFAP